MFERARMEDTYKGALFNNKSATLGLNNIVNSDKNSCKAVNLSPWSRELARTEIETI